MVLRRFRKRKNAGPLESNPAEFRDEDEMQLSNAGQPAAESELDAEADLALSIGGEVARRSRVGHDSKVTVVQVRIRTVELGSVEGVEVIHRENRPPSLANVEVLFGIDVFQSARGRFSCPP